MMKWDMHIHTSRHSPDAITDPVALVRRAKEMDLDGIVITEHDYLWTHAELEELRKAEPGLIILAGVEVASRGGDVLCYGVKNPFALPKGMPFADVCREVQRQGGVAVAAHPYRWGQPFDDILIKHNPLLSGLEMMSKNMDAELRSKTAKCLEKHPHFAAIGNSDSHELETLGCCYTEIDADIRTIDDLVIAIRTRKTLPRARV